ncbi:hypothetical protein AAIH70_25175 [Neorhizobium sp. BT27B]|uniref:bestrophin-like domain n=1 Tax=Neorhizobium sp. BT27B TaxID=3142625 RepID=UPI003D290536
MVILNVYGKQDFNQMGHRLPSFRTRGMDVREIGFSVGVAVLLTFASLLVLFLYPKLPARHRDDETNTVVRLVANIFVVVASLAFGLIMNSSKNTFESVDASVHTFATKLILLDLGLRSYGLEGDQARSALRTYVEGAVEQQHHVSVSGPGAAAAQGRLQSLGQALYGLETRDAFHHDLAGSLQDQYAKIVEQRWSIVESATFSISSRPSRM